MAPRSVVVKEGDTLWSLARLHLGNPDQWPRIWYLNTARIIGEQRRRGLYPNKPEDWIFPGTELRLPEVSTMRSKPC